MALVLQVSSHHRNKVDDIKMTQVSKLLKALSMKNHKSYALARLAASASSDTFAKVKGLIEDMIDRLTKEAAEVAEIDQSQSEATAIREAEKAEFEKASAEYSQSAEAVASAISVLQSYYSSGSFVQTKQAPEFGGSNTDIGSTIVE